MMNSALICATEAVSRPKPTFGVPPKYGSNDPVIYRSAKKGFEGLGDGCPIKDVPANLFKLLSRLIVHTVGVHGQR